MASPDAHLEYVIIHILGFTLTHPVGLALPQSYITTFDDFCTIDVDDVYEFQYSTTPKGSPDTNCTTSLSSKFNVLFIMLATRKVCKMRNPMTQHYGARLHTLNGVETDTRHTSQH
jgi:hypothetical protein